MSKEINLKELQRFSNIELIAREVVEGFITGLHRSPLHGFSVEFAEHRQYNTGESTRFIDWKLYARTEKLFVKRFEEETNLRALIILDVSSSMYYPDTLKNPKQSHNKIAFSIYCAASLIYLLRKQRDAVGLATFSDDIHICTKARSSSVHQKLLFTELEKLLNQIPEKQRTFAAKAIHTLAESIHKRSLIVIFSDMFDNSEKSEEIFQALQHLRHCKHEVILFHVFDKNKELNFEFDNRPHKFKDLETGEEIKVQPTAIKTIYTELMNKYKNLIKQKCGQYKVDYVEADINEGFSKVLMTYLLKREKLY